MKNLEDFFERLKNLIRKDETELAIISKILNECHIEYFNILVGRIVPDRNLIVSKVDRVLARSVGGLGQYLAGRIVFDGVVLKEN